MNKYKSFVKMDYPEKFDYETADLKNGGYEFKLRVDKRNIDFEKYCDDLKSKGKDFKIVDLKIENKIDIWVKNNQNLARS